METKKKTYLSDTVKERIEKRKQAREHATSVLKGLDNRPLQTMRESPNPYGMQR